VLQEHSPLSARRRSRLGKLYLVRIYPPVGPTPEDGHNALDEAIPVWEGDVFTFLDRYLKS
jgi:hypothetical protein